MEAKRVTLASYFLAVQRPAVPSSTYSLILAVGQLASVPVSKGQNIFALYIDEQDELELSLGNTPASRVYPSGSRISEHSRVNVRTER